MTTERQPSDSAMAERARVVAWLRSDERLSCRFGPDFADMIERGDHDYPAIPRMKLGPVGEEG